MNKILRNLFLIFTLILLVMSCSKADSNTKTIAPVTVTEPVVSESAVNEAKAAPLTELVTLTESSPNEEFNIVLGEKMSDFTFVDYKGNEHNLYSILEDKDCVLINLFATWCGPCYKEFPFMQQSYEDYKDRVEIIALSTEKLDTPEVLSQYSEELGLSFLVGRDELDFYSMIGRPGVPTTIVIDKFGNISIIEVGSKAGKAYFDSLFNYYLSNYYTESEILDEFPAVLSTEPHCAIEDLSAALDINSDRIKLENPDTNAVWPMAITEYDGKTVLTPTNTLPYSYSAIKATIDAEAKEGFSITCAIPGSVISKHAVIKVDGKPVKYFTNNDEWMTFTYQFETSGEHEVMIEGWANLLVYYTGTSDNLLYFDSLKYLNEEETLRGLENNTAYTVSEELKIYPDENTKAEEIRVIADFSSYFEEFYIVESSDPKIEITVDQNNSAESIYLLSADILNNKVNITRLIDLYENGKFTKTLNNSGEEDEYCIFVAAINLDLNLLNRTFFFSSEDVVNAYFADLMVEEGTPIDWEYVNTEKIKTTEMITLEEIIKNQLPSEVTYTVKYVDQDGNPVVGAMLQVCDDTLCQVFVSDSNGLCTFTLPPFEYELHTLMVPAGYESNSEIYSTNVSGEALTIVINKQ